MPAGRHPLHAFTAAAPRHDRGRTLNQLIGLSLLVSTAAGLWLLTVESPPPAPPRRDVAQRITFHAPVLPVVEPAPPSAPAPPAPAPDPVDLAHEPVLAQPVDRPAPAPPPAPAAADDEAAPGPAPRRVYGVRRVLARSLGAGGATHTGLVVERGNVLDGRADTLTATPVDLRGALAALSTVERAPEPVHRVKPRYSEALLAARASGTVSARMLVDADGRVATVEILADIGYDSAAVAAAALRRFRFRPALRRGEPVAVWILHRIRFEFQE